MTGWLIVSGLAVLAAACVAVNYWPTDRRRGHDLDGWPMRAVMGAELRATLADDISDYRTEGTK